MRNSFDSLFALCSTALENVQVRARAGFMGAFPTERWFRLSEDGVRCDEEGLSVGGAAVLVRSPAHGGGWAVRAAAEKKISGSKPAPSAAARIAGQVRD